jgi:hypothetical protein
MAGGKRALGVLIVMLIAPSVAHADFTAPELYIAEGDSSSTQSQPPVWQSLAGAKLVGAYRYRVGVKVQANDDSLGREYVLVQAFQSPTAPAQGSAINPPVGSCYSVRGTPGDIAQFATASYYGDGQYSLTAALAPHQSGPCPTSGGASAGGTFAVDARPTLSFEGGPRSHDARPEGGFRGVRIAPSPDSTIPEIRCALDPVVQADGSLKGSVVTHSDDLSQPDQSWGMPEADAFPHAGNWSCVGRIVGGPDDLHSGWTTPISTVIPGDFAVDDQEMVDRTYPTYVIRFFVDRGDAGGTLSFDLHTCHKYSKNISGKHLSPKRLRLRAVVNARGRAIFRLRRKLPATQFGRYFVGRARFSGTSFVAAATSRQTFAFAEYNDLFEGKLMGVYTPAGC